GGQDNNLTISVAGGTYTLNDPAETFDHVINGGHGTTVAGQGTNTVIVRGIASIHANTGDGNDTVNLRSTGVPTTIDTSAGTDDAVNIGSLAPATGGDLLRIAAVVKVDDQDSASLNLDDSGDPTGRAIALGQLGALTGILVSGLPNITVAEHIARV